MKKIISAFLALAMFLVGAGIVSAQTTAQTSVSDASGGMTTAQVKTLVKKVNKVKAKSNSTKQKIAINKKQLTNKIAIVKKARAKTKTARLRTKIKSNKASAL